MSPRNRLAAIFSPTRRLTDAERAVVRQGGVLGGLQWVVPRADCHYRRMEFPTLAVRQRDAAARIAARRHEPTPGALFHVAWEGPAAHVWTWPTPGVDAGGDTVDWVPESLLRAPPAGDGLRLLRQVRGFEGQYWRSGELQASQWWPQLPGDESWRRFVRACGLSPGAVSTVPEPESPGWSDPWGDQAHGLHVSPARLERWGWVAMVAIVVSALGWQVAADFAWSRARSRMDGRMEALRAEAAPLLAARERAEAARASLEELRRLQDGLSDYRLMAEVIAPLPAGARLQEWSREGPKLAVVVQSPDADPRHFVSAYDGHPLLADVIATPLDNGNMGLAFTLADAPPLAQTAQTAQTAQREGASP